MCIDPARPLILRDIIDADDKNTGFRLVRTTTFVDFESTLLFHRIPFRFQLRREPLKRSLRFSQGGSTARN